MSKAYSLALDSSNAIYVTDYGNNRIKNGSKALRVHTVAGQSNGASGASSTALSTPVGIILDSSNNMYFTDRGNHRVMYWANGASSGSVIAGITGIESS
jgi:sugar lactone lactonase YvrE